MFNKMYSCKRCKTTFTRQYSLLRHQKRACCMQEEKDQQLSECDKEKNQKPKIQWRLCNDCGKTVSSRRTLWCHRKSCKAVQKRRIDIIAESDILDKEKDDEELKKKLVEGNQRYLEKVWIGEKIAKILREDNIHEESLSAELEEALGFYRKRLE